jgi:Mce-associated membrane protein
VNEDEAPTTAADIRALAEQAEAEAAEAEALAAAARARARAIQLRRRAQLAEALKDAEAQKDEALADDAAAGAATDIAVAAEATDVAPESSDVQTGETQEIEGEDDSGVAPERAAEPESATLLAPAAAPPRGRGRLSGRLRRPKWSTVAAGLAIIVILGALGGSAYMIEQHRDAVRQHQREAEFAAAARQGVVTLTSLDFNDAKQGVQRIVDNSTGSFKDDFVKMADDFTKVVEKSKVVSQGTVAATAVERDSMTNDSAVVLVASTSEVTNAAGAKQDPRNYRLIVTVARDGGQLKISKVEFVP